LKVIQLDIAPEEIGHTKATEVSSRFDFQMQREAGASGERDQRIETELPDTAAQQIVQSRLRHAEVSRGLYLGHMPCRHGLGDRDHQDRSELHVFRFCRGVFQCIPHAFNDLGGHRLLTICSRSRDTAKSRSRMSGQAPPIRILYV